MDYSQLKNETAQLLLKNRGDTLNQQEIELFDELAKGMPSDEYKEWSQAIQKDKEDYFNELMNDFANPTKNKHNVNNYLPNILKKLKKTAIALGIAGLVLTAGCIDEVPTDILQPTKEFDRVGFCEPGNFVKISYDGRTDKFNVPLRDWQGYKDYLSAMYGKDTVVVEFSEDNLYFDNDGDSKVDEAVRGADSFCVWIGNGNFSKGQCNINPEIKNKCQEDQRLVNIREITEKGNLKINGLWCYKCEPINKTSKLYESVNETDIPLLIEIENETKLSEDYAIALPDLTVPESEWLRLQYDGYLEVDEILKVRNLKVQNTGNGTAKGNKFKTDLIMSGPGTSWRGTCYPVLDNLKPNEIKETCLPGPLGLPQIVPDGVGYARICAKVDAEKTEFYDDRTFGLKGIVNELNESNNVRCSEPIPVCKDDGICESREPKACGDCR